MAVASTSTPDSKSNNEQETQKLPETGPSNSKPAISTQNGKICHQCRHHKAFTADCNNHTRNKQCTLKFCHTCLLNRYGEKAEEVALLEDWSCPRCRGICNCSSCMKKRGHQPTGMLSREAKASGFTSVSDLLHVKGFENVGPYMSTKDTKIASPGKLSKENSFEGKIDVNPNLPSASSTAKENTKKMKKGSKEIQDVNRDTVLSKESGSSAIGKKRKKMKPEVSEETTNGILQKEISPSVEVLDSKAHQDKIQNNVVTESHMDAYYKCVDDDIPLPKGTLLTSVAGIDLPAHDVGHALQFLEFCAAFGKILDVKRGHAEAILRELINGRTTRQGKSTLIIQFQIQLLSLIQKDSGSPPLSATGGKNSWVSVLKECVRDSYCSIDSLPMDLLDTDGGGYDSLDTSMKLRLLNFLCDEVLETAELRTWIEDNNSKFSDETKEAKAKVIAAKHEEKLLQQKMQDDIAKAVVAKNGAPLSISEHEDIVSQNKREVAQAHAQMLDFKSMVTRDKQISKAVRTEAVHLDSNGCTYWRLKGYSDESEILGQDIGSRDEVEAGEKWFTYDAEQTKLIEKKIKSLSNRERRIKRKIQSQCMALPLENKDVILR